MNFYPSWIHRIPEMLEALALLPAERIDRRRVEALFALGRSTAHELLRRFGAERCGNSLTISRARLMARLREMQEHPDWRWERERRGQIRERIEDLRPTKSRSLVPVGTELQRQIDGIAILGLPDTIRFVPGGLMIRCRSMKHLVEQLVLVAKALDTDYETKSVMKPASGPSRTTRVLIAGRDGVIPPKSIRPISPKG